MRRAKAQGYQSEIENLVDQGYDAETIKRILTDGLYAVFYCPQGPNTPVTTANLMNEMSPAERARFLNIVQQYQATHPDLTSHQVLNYLHYTQLVAQGTQFQQEINNSPINNATYHNAILRLLDRLNQNALMPMQNVQDPFMVSDGQLGINGGGWKSDLVGLEGEWGVIQNYYNESLTNPNLRLVDFSVPYAQLGTGETDIIIEENGINKWVEVKNITNIKMRSGKWRNLRDQVTNMMNEGTKNIIVDLPQGVPDDVKRNLIALGQGRGVTITVQSTPGIPYEPPIPPDWGKALPIPQP